MNEPEDGKGWSVPRDTSEQDTGDGAWSLPHVLFFVALGLVFGYWGGLVAVSIEQESVTQ